MGLMAVVTWQLAVAALFDWITIGLALLSGAVVWRSKVNSAWLVLAGAVIGLLVHVVG
jgi:chromate transporter